MAEDINTIEEAKPKKVKKEKVLSEKELQKRSDKEKAIRKAELRKQSHEDMFRSEKDLVIKQKLEQKRAKKGFIISGLLILSGVGLPFGIYKLIKTLKSKRLIQNPVEIRRLLIVEEAQKKHKLSNDAILSAYKKEKKRIKALKRLPFKILNSVTFLLSMFSIILFFFVLDVGLVPTALIVFGVFALSYFAIGLVMHIIFYMISENKERELMLKLESDKNKLLAEEKIRSEELIRTKIEKERRRFEEEERLRIEEIERVKREEELLHLRQIEEQRLLELTLAEKQRLLKKHLVGNELLPSATQAEMAQTSEILRNESDKRLLSEIEEQFVVPNISGIEDFGGLDKYSVGTFFNNSVESAEEINLEMDNGLLDIVKEEVDLDNGLTNFDTADIEEAKTLIFENARKKVGSSSDDLVDNEDKSKSVSGKSFMVIKQMLKDN